MLKKVLLGIVAVLLSMAVNAQQQWISFGNKAEGAPPEISVQQNDNQVVSFTVNFAGMYVESKSEASSVYQRLSMPECYAIGEIGSPEIPVLSKMIAIPECSDILYNVTLSGVQTFSNYLVYPVPTLEFLPDGNGGCSMEEVFTKDAMAYSQNAFMPVETYTVVETGYLRAQRYLQIELHPMQYNPVTKTLTVATEMEVTLTFINATTPVNANVGIFNSVATDAMINYEDTGISATINDKAFKKDGYQRGNVQWKKINTPQDVQNITADYLIICAEAFYPSGGQPNAEVLRIANHRADYNAFDILILNVEDILSDAVGFYYEPTPDPSVKKVRRIRTCIRTIYNTGYAPHIGDGKLGYVLIIGDTEEVDQNGKGGSSDTYVPVSYDHHSSELICPHARTIASDYYYSCITGTPDGLTDIGDLYIGRFSVENTTQLHNIVEKTIYHETDISGGAWRKSTEFIFTSSIDEADIFHAYVRYVFLPGLFNGTEWSYTTFTLNAPEQNPPIYNSLNKGVVYAQYCGLAYSDGWHFMNKNSFLNNLTNDYMAPFITSYAYHTGRIDYVGEQCLAEFLTTYSDTRGAVGYVGISGGVTLYDPNRPINEITKNYPDHLFNYGYSIAGEFLLKTLTKSFVGYLGSYLNSKYGHILFGDPALNILAERNCNLLTGVLSTNLVIPAGECYTIPENEELFIENSNSITVAGGLLIIEDNAKITSYSQHNPNRFINVQEGAVEIGNNVEIKNINFQTTLSLSGIHFDHVNFTRSNTGNSVFNMSNCHFSNNSTVLLNNHYKNANVTNCTFTDTKITLQSSKREIPIVVDASNSQFTNSPIFHYNHKLVATNCTFSSRSDIVASFPVVDIDHCSFLESGFYANTPSSFSWGEKNFIPFVKIINSSFRGTGEFIINPGIDPPVYSRAAIKLEGIGEFQITADTIVNKFKDDPYDGIYLNNAGQGNVDNRLISGNDIFQCRAGLHVYSSKVTFKNNNIHDNVEMGAMLFNNSSTSFFGESVISNGQQLIRNNGWYEIYTSQNSFPTSFKYNQIIDEDYKGYTLIYYDVPGGTAPSPLNVTCNYWDGRNGNLTPRYDLYPASGYIYNPIWDKVSLCSKSGSLYQDGIDYFSDENYTAAKSAFIELIETEPQSEYAIAALHELFALEQFIDNDYSALHDYYAAFTPADTTLFDVADFLATRCNVVDQNWQPAIDWYENRIAEPPSYPDSVFAVIDLGDIHLMMENDSSSLKAGRVLRFPHLIPKSKREYEENKAELLATLPKIDQPKHPLAETGKTGVLSQNIPNPANGSTTVVYDVIKDGQVELRMYNQLGQLLQTLPQGTKKEGTYRTVISLTGLPAGMYHYVLFINGEKADAKKLIVN